MSSLAACQLPGGAFLQTGTATVISCVETPVVAAEKAGGKKAKAAPAASSPSSSSSSSAPAAATPAGPTFDVVLSQTVLFPEGGGQPTDTGLIEVGGESIKVLSVARVAGGVVHKVERAVPVGADVSLKVDWARRFDHMQCHSSQHLISAVAKTTLGFKTLSWWLASAPQECHIELDTGAAGMTPEQMQGLERDVNAWIQKGTPIRLHTYASLAAARADDYFVANISKSVPDTQEGAIRVIEIAGLEHNPCCGTHLDSLAQMGAIKLTRVEKGKTSSKLFFFTGDRTLAALQSSLDIQRALTSSLCCAPEQFPDAVKRMQGELKAANKQLTSVLKELAESDAAKIVAALQSASAAGTPKVAQLNRDEFGLNYLANVSDLVAAAAPPAPYLLFLSSSDAAAGAAGAFLLVGDEALVAACAPELAVKLQGKGGGRKGKYQGKATGLDSKSRHEAFALLTAKVAELAAASSKSS